MSDQDKKVFVCEDEPDLARAIESELSGRYGVMLSETGAEAMVAARYAARNRRKAGVGRCAVRLTSTPHPHLPSIRSHPHSFAGN